MGLLFNHPLLFFQAVMPLGLMLLKKKYKADFIDIFCL